MRTFVLSLFIVVMHGILLPSCAYSQVTAGDKKEGVNYSFYPIMGYSSDIGLFGGGLFQRIDYTGGARPFLTNILADVTGSTNGKWAGSFEYERTQMFGRPLRSLSMLSVERNPISNYFGVGNKTEFSSAGYNEGLFYLLQRRIVSRFELRKPLRSIYDNKSLEGVLRLKLSYTDNEDRGTNTRFIQSPPPGVSGGWVNTIGGGLIYDLRDNEFDPRSGFRGEIGADFSTVAAGNDFGFSSYFGEFKSYVPIFDNTVFAQRIVAKHTYGSVPFFELPTLGNKYGLRGYAINRFLGKSSVLYMAEIRSWILRLYEDQIKFGGHLFFDTGRVFSGSDSPVFFNNWKRTWGFGGALSAFNPDLIFRGELGFSDESYRIYAGVGFAF